MWLRMHSVDLAGPVRAFFATDATLYLGADDVRSVMGVRNFDVLRWATRTVRDVLLPSLCGEMCLDDDVMEFEVIDLRSLRGIFRRDYPAMAVLDRIFRSTTADAETRVIVSSLLPPHPGRTVEVNVGVDGGIPMNEFLDRFMRETLRMYWNYPSHFRAAFEMEEI